MEYLFGSAMTIISIIIIKLFSDRISAKESISGLKYSQSQVFELVKPFMSVVNINKKNKKPSQASKHYLSQTVPVIFLDSKAYWIRDNVFYEAQEQDGFIDKESAKPVDIMGMDKVQLEKMVFIVETLTKGAGDDSWNSGK